MEEIAETKEGNIESKVESKEDNIDIQDDSESKEDYIDIQDDSELVDVDSKFIRSPKKRVKKSYKLKKIK